MENKTVFHYCSLDTFLCILKNRTIRLSDIHKLNDSTETKVFLDILKKPLTSFILSKFKGDFENFIQGMSGETAIKYLVNTIIEQIKKYNDPLRYVACFSKNGDLLSQWIRYADDGRGVSLGFKTKLFNNIAKLDSQLHFKKVKYVDAKKIDSSYLLAKYAQLFVDNLSIHIEYNEIDNVLTSADRIPNYLKWYLELMDDSIFNKHNSFRDEQEWRFALIDESLSRSSGEWGESYNWKIVDHFNNKDKSDAVEDQILVNLIKKLFPNGLEFRSRGDDIISYLDLKFCDENEWAFDIFNEIIIGPNSKLNEDDVSQILQHYHYENDISVKKSSSPYRIV